MEASIVKKFDFNKCTNVVICTFVLVQQSHRMSLFDMINLKSSTFKPFPMFPKHSKVNIVYSAHFCFINFPSSVAFMYVLRLFQPTNL